MLAPIAAENPLRVIPRFHLVRMDESPYNVSIQYYNVKDVHEQPEWPSTSYPAACILSNRLFCNANSVFGFVVMIDDFSSTAELSVKNSSGAQNVPHLTYEGLTKKALHTNSWMFCNVNINRCDLARGWRPEVAGRPRTIPAPRRPDRYLSVLAATDWVQRGPLLRLTDRRSRDNRLPQDQRI
ncbi:hypothetical protein T01_5850 [Trichinella spiralis]|uniref:Uncharacterized protein n=1 Tax=Trichinella spiralis TaxID=6334 RepID=A0A0V1B7N1_TRISP|nr:hypothetical protein T01_5850 [Trichinella spiralis]